MTNASDSNASAVAGTLDEKKFVKTADKPKGQWQIIGQRTLYRWSGQASQSAIIFRSKRLELDDDGGVDAYHPPTPEHPNGRGKGLGRDALGNASSQSKTAYNAKEPDKLINGLPWDHMKNTHWCGIAVDPATQRPYIQGLGDPYPTFYVAKTALFDHSLPEKDPKRWVDASSIPYLVLYRQIHRLGVNQGDFAAVVINETASPRVVYAIVADAKGFGHGEGSRALVQDITKRQSGGSVDRKDMTFILFPRSAKTPAWSSTYSREDVVKRARSLFQKWGDLAEVEKFSAAVSDAP